MSFFRHPIRTLVQHFKAQQQKTLEQKAHAQNVAALREAVLHGGAEDVRAKVKAVRVSRFFHPQRDWNPQVFAAVARDDVDVFFALLPRGNVNACLLERVTGPETHYSNVIPVLNLAITNGRGEKKIAMALARHPDIDIMTRREVTHSSGVAEDGPSPLDLARRLGPPALLAVLHERTAEALRLRGEEHLRQAIAARPR